MTRLVCCLAELELCLQVIKAIDAGRTNGLYEIKPEHMKGIVWLQAQMKCLAELLIEALEDVICLWINMLTCASVSADPGVKQTLAEVPKLLGTALESMAWRAGGHY